MITTTGVSHAFHGNPVLRDVSVAVRPGQILAVLGSNGAGKTTLLRALAGEIRPQAGRITLEGRCLSQWPGRELALRRAVLSQNIEVTFPFPVWDIVLMGRYAHNRGHESERDYTVAELALKHADAYRFIDRRYDTLSGGEKQRVQLARVLAQIWDGAGTAAARYLFLDEPTSSLDIEHQYRLMTFIRRFADEQVGVFCVLHDINLAAAFADRLLFMKDGEVLAQGPVDEVLSGEVIEGTYGLGAEIHRASGRPFVVPVCKEA